MDEKHSDLVKGTLDLLILSALAVEPMHGWGITQNIEQMSREVLLVNQGSLYPGLARLQRKGLITDEWRTTENNRRARYYSLTEAGWKQLQVEKGIWERSSMAVNWVLNWSEGSS